MSAKGPEDDIAGATGGPLLSKLRHHIVHNARLLGSARHDWDFVRLEARVCLLVLCMQHV